MFFVLKKGKAESLLVKPMSQQEQSRISFH